MIRVNRDVPRAAACFAITWRFKIKWSARRGVPNGTPDDQLPQAFRIRLDGRAMMGLPPAIASAADDTDPAVEAILIEGFWGVSRGIGGHHDLSWQDVVVGDLAALPAVDHDGDLLTGWEILPGRIVGRSPIGVDVDLAVDPVDHPIDEDAGALYMVTCWRSALTFVLDTPTKSPTSSASGIRCL